MEELGLDECTEIECVSVCSIDMGHVLEMRTRMQELSKRSPEQDHLKSIQELLKCPFSPKDQVSCRSYYRVLTCLWQDIVGQPRDTTKKQDISEKDSLIRSETVDYVQGVELFMEGCRDRLLQLCKTVNTEKGLCVLCSKSIPQGEECLESLCKHCIHLECIDFIVMDPTCIVCKRPFF